MQKYPKFSGILPLDPTRDSLQHPLLPTAPQTPPMHSSFSPRYACQKTGTPPKIAGYGTDMVSDGISSNIYEIFSINPSADAFVFGGFSIYYKYWLTYYATTK